MKKLLGYFIRGSLVLTPLAATFYLFFVVLRAIDQLLPIGIPGLGALVTFVLVTLVGAATSHVLGKTVLDTVEGVVARVPLVNLIYGSVRDLTFAFAGERKSFDRPVAVRLPGDIRALGFITRDELPSLNASGTVAVYFPQSYNFAGNVLLVPREAVELLHVPSAELMTFIVSGGVSGLGKRTPAPPAKAD